LERRKAERRGGVRVEERKRKNEKRREKENPKRDEEKKWKKRNSQCPREALAGLAEDKRLPDCDWDCDCDWRSE
jgi:hypothetical protein